MCQTGDFSGGLVPVNNTLGSGLLNDGNSFHKALLGLFMGVFGDGRPDFPDGLLDPGLITLVSYASDFVLLGPFKG